ncbi:MAG: hypothetical protein C4294_18630 [Nitrospiraceae bacterium]
MNTAANPIKTQTNAPTAAPTNAVSEKVKAPEKMSRNEILTEIKALRDLVDRDKADASDLDRLHKLEQAKLHIRESRKTEIASVIAKLATIGDVKLLELFPETSVKELLEMVEQNELRSAIKGMGYTKTAPASGSGNSTPTVKKTGELPSEKGEPLMFIAKTSDHHAALDFQYKAGRLYENVLDKGQQSDKKIAKYKASGYGNPYMMGGFPDPLLKLAKEEFAKAKPDLKAALHGKLNDAGKEHFKKPENQQEFDHLVTYVANHWEKAAEAKAAAAKAAAAAKTAKAAAAAKA